ncbi:MAG: 5-methylcytosine restriction system specificity protein McrC [Verrucomicrobiales bacterium]
MSANRTQKRGNTRVVRDSTASFIPVLDWFPPTSAIKDPEKAGQKLAESFLNCNRGILKDFKIISDVRFKQGIPGVALLPSTRIGAFPLLSPTTGKPDFGLVIEPRFTWSTAGKMFAAMGFRTVPEILPLPYPPQSERQIPAWLISSIVLPRIRQLLDTVHRRFEFTEQVEPAPRGTVQWNDYASHHLARGRADQVPCRFPDLRNDRELLSAIRWVVFKHKNSLLGQRAHGRVVHELLLECDILLRKLGGYTPMEPRGSLLNRLHRRAGINTKVFREGLQAIEWTAEERGLAGLSDLAGLAWSLEMEVFFETWVESIAERFARSAGGSIKVGRKRETQVPIDWLPPSLGSQRSLVPDIVVAKEDVVLVIDAKYKRHAEEIERSSWNDLSDDVREQHREDVLQALAYSTLFNSRRVITCLAYPTAANHWETLNERNRTMSHATIRQGQRSVEIVLLAVPLSGNTDPIVEKFSSLVA